MSHELETGLNPIENNELQIVFQQLSEEAINLRIVEKFFSEIERRLLKDSSPAFDIEPIKVSLQTLKLSNQETPLTDIWQIEFNLKQEFQYWRNLLIERDDQIETYHFRRFCDSSDEPLDSLIFSALTRFYRHRSHTPLSQSKFDLAVTRLFTKERGATIRQQTLERSALTARLSDLFDKWDCKSSEVKDLTNDTQTAITKIDDFIRETRSLGNFEELIKNKLFDRFREFKRDLAKSFFEPAIVAASIECNIAVGNAFNTLLGNANENLSTKLISNFGFAEVFHDTSPNAKIRTSEILHEVKLHETADGTVESEELLHIWELLEFASSDQISIQPPAAEKATVEEKFTTKKSLPPEDRIGPLLDTIYQEEPNTKLLRDYMQQSKLLISIDLTDFLNSPDARTDEICREALCLIIWSVEIQENELTNLKNLPVTIRSEVKSILRKSQNVAEQLGYLVEISDQATQNRLLLVSNKLLETSFKLERAVVRFSNRNLRRPKQAEEVPKVENPVNPMIDPGSQPVAKVGTNRWLVAATVLFFLLSGGMFLFSQQMKNSIPASHKLEKIDIFQLPRGEHLIAAYRLKTTLLVTAKESWRHLPNDDQAETLQVLLHYPTEPKLDTVIVNDEKGEPLADTSPNGTSFGGIPQIDLERK
jgi:hypothetical protein